jgi:DNA-directed RNA polymerase subunit beta
MMRQAVPLIRPEAPIVGTGLERQVASDSRVLINAEDGVIEYVDANIITIKYDRSEEERMVSFDSDEKTYNLIKFRKTNQGTSINLKPIVRRGIEWFPSAYKDMQLKMVELALGRNPALCHGKGITLRMRLLFLRRWFRRYFHLYSR